MKPWYPYEAEDKSEAILLKTHEAETILYKTYKAEEKPKPHVLLAS